MNASNLLAKSYDYDAFGVEKNPSDEDNNPFRYCGEYYDTETGTYYLRARYYDPSIGRFTQQDTHWNTSNMIYGDNPQKINERENKLELKTYSYAPQISAVVQSGNLYVYAVGNPIRYFDYYGSFIISTAAILITSGIIIGGIIGGIAGSQIADAKGATGWNKAGYIAGYSIAGGISGGMIGAAAAPVVTVLTGVAGVSVTAADISTLSVTSV